MLILLAAAYAAAAVPAAGQTRYTEHTLRKEASTPGPRVSLSSVAWLAGRWRGEGLGAVAEEMWLPAAGNAMAGVFRLVKDGQVQFYELVTLVEEDGTLVLRLKHFEPGLIGWEEKADAVEFPLLRADAETLWFDGLTMRRVGAGDELHVWVALQRSGQAVQEALFSYRRVDAKALDPPGR